MDDRVDAVGQSLDEVAQAHHVDRLLDLLVRDAGAAEGEVGANRAREEERLLGNDTQLGAQRVQGHGADVDAVKEDPARRRVVEAVRELGHG